MKCKLCEKDIDRIEGHHLSYIPEQIIELCHSCHKLLHLLNEFDLTKLSIALNLVNEYGNNWINGRDQYENSDYRKVKRLNAHKAWMRAHPNKVQEYNKRYALIHKDQIAKYNKEYYQRPEVKERILKRQKRIER